MEALVNAENDGELGERFTALGAEIEGGTPAATNGAACRFCPA